MCPEHRARRLKLLLVLVLGLAVLGGCSTPYILHLAQGQTSVLLASRPFEEVIDDPATEPEVRAKLEIIQQAKRFGEEVVGLKADGGFSTFVPTKGPAALYVVTAAPKLELRVHTWSFPLVGSFPYKGFFDRALAEAEEARLAAAGLDTHLRAATAYSTLGWFTDPVFEPLLQHNDILIANIIFHEKTHATVFVPDNMAFNEGLASFVGEQGAIDFFASIDGHGSPRHEEAVKRVEDERRFGRFLRRVLTELQRLYSSELSPEEKLKRRERIFEMSRLKLLGDRGHYHYPDLVEFYTATRINNAFLLSLQLYTVDVKTYVETYEHHGRDLAKTVAFFKAVGKVTNDPRAYVRQWLRRGGAQAAAPARATP